MAVDLDAILSARGPDALIEATLNGRSIKFKAMTVKAAAKINANKFDEGFIELLDDPADWQRIEQLPVDILDTLLGQLYGDQLGKRSG
jgi:hypothetical protein